MATMKAQPAVYGIMGEFDSPEALTKAVHRAHKLGYRKMDAFSPFPIEEINETIGPHDTGVPRLVLIFGLLGAAGGFILQSIAAWIDYPINIGGRALNIIAWPAFIPITFEAGVLSAAFAATFGMIGLNGLPSPYHPVFNVPGFDRASQDAFFLCIEATDPMFGGASGFLRQAGAVRVSVVEH